MTLVAGTEEPETKTVPEGKRTGLVPAEKVERYGIIAVVLVMMLVLAILKPGVFLSVANLTNIVKQNASAAVAREGDGPRAMRLVPVAPPRFQAPERRRREP